MMMEIWWINFIIAESNYFTMLSKKNLMIKKITKKIIGLSVISLFTVHSVFAQYTLQSTNLPNAGDTWVNKTIADTSIQPGGAGANVIWDFNLYSVTVNTLSEEFRAPSSTGVDATFPTANIKEASYFGWTDYFYKNPAGTEIQYLGFQNSSNEVRITNTQKLLTVPLTYGTSISNAALMGTGYFGSTLTGTISVIADGYGTLKVGTLTFNNVTRVKYDFNMVEDFGGGSESPVHVVKYSWYRSGLRPPVMSISTLNMSGIVGNSVQKYTTVNYLVTDVEDLDKPVITLNTFPNPSKGLINVQFNIDRTAEVTTQLMDITGRVRISEVSRQNVGEHNLKLDVSDLPKGVYVLSVISGTVNRQQRILITE